MKMMMEMARDGMKQKKLEEEATRKEKSDDKEKKEDEDDSQIIPVEQYFVFFLKFIATICPV